jgi:formylglycine-generating enzyme required for sulfatase activity
MKTWKRAFVGVVAIIGFAFTGCETGEEITEIPVAVTEVTLDKDKLELEAGHTALLTATVLPEKAANKNISWSSSNRNVATVNNGTVTAVAEGKATVIVTTVDGGKFATCAVTVNPATVPGAVTGVTLDKDKLDLTVGGTALLTATVLPADATNQNVTWESDDEDVATVDDGTVTALALGTATITVTTVDGNKTATCTVTVGIEGMIWIKPGTFKMGSPDVEIGRDSGDETQHDVILTKGFYMGIYPVTQGLYKTVTGESPSHFTTPVAPETSTADRPVEMVSWYDAIVFCNKLSMQENLSPAYRIDGKTNPAEWGTVHTSRNATWDSVTIEADSTGYRLPTEAQWEYACRAGTLTPFFTGGNITTDQANYDGNNPYNNNAKGEYLERTSKVGSYAPNAWGLYDMHGNVFELCWDWYDYGYVEGERTDPSGEVSGATRMGRGGSWYDSGRMVRSAYRGIYTPMDRTNKTGFRIVRP